MSHLVGLLTIGWAIAAARYPKLVRIQWRWLGVTSMVFLGVIAWLLIQTSTLTPEAWHHPIWVETAKALRRPVAGAISLEPDAGVTGEGLNIGRFTTLDESSGIILPIEREIEKKSF